MNALNESAGGGERADGAGRSGASGSRLPTRPEAVVREALLGWHRQVAELLDRIAAVVAGCLPAQPTRLAGDMEACMRGLLPRETHFAGGGFVSLHSTVLAHGGSLLWWTSKERAGVRVLAPLDDGLTELGDYQRSLDDVEWYRVPAVTGRSHMTGPYVDYLCTDEFSLTFTRPIVIAGEFYGVVGLDVLVRDVEHDVEAALDELDAGAVLLANGRSVVVSVDPGLNTGRRVTDDWLADRSVTDLVGTEFSIALPHGAGSDHP